MLHNYNQLVLNEVRKFTPAFPAEFRQMEIPNGLLIMASGDFGLDGLGSLGGPDGLDGLDGLDSLGGLDGLDGLDSLVRGQNINSEIAPKKLFSRCKKLFSFLFEWKKSLTSTSTFLRF